MGQNFWVNEKTKAKSDLGELVTWAPAISRFCKHFSSIRSLKPTAPTWIDAILKGKSSNPQFAGAMLVSGMVANTLDYKYICQPIFEGNFWRKPFLAILLQAFLKHIFLWKFSKKNQKRCPPGESEDQVLTVAQVGGENRSSLFEMDYFFPEVF